MPNLTKIYICHPITGEGDMEANLIGKIEWILKLLCNDSVSPLAVCREVPAGSPPEAYLRKRIEAIIKCDGYVCSANWKSSQTCRMEVMVARKCGVKLLGTFNESELTIKI